MPVAEGKDDGVEGEAFGLVDGHDLQGFLEEFAVISKEDQVKKLHDMLGNRVQYTN